MESGSGHLPRHLREFQLQWSPNSRQIEPPFDNHIPLWNPIVCVEFGGASRIEFVEIGAERRVRKSGGRSAGQCRGGGGSALGGGRRRRSCINFILFFSELN